MPGDFHSGRVCVERGCITPIRPYAMTDVQIHDNRRTSDPDFSRETPRRGEIC